jgi:hypothetical protein
MQSSKRRCSWYTLGQDISPSFLDVSWCMIEHFMSVIPQEIHGGNYTSVHVFSRFLSTLCALNWVGFVFFPGQKLWHASIPWRQHVLVAQGVLGCIWLQPTPAPVLVWRCGGSEEEARCENRTHHWREPQTIATLAAADLSAPADIV